MRGLSPRLHPDRAAVVRWSAALASVAVVAIFLVHGAWLARVRATKKGGLWRDGQGGNGALFFDNPWAEVAALVMAVGLTVLVSLAQLIHLTWQLLPHLRRASRAARTAGGPWGAAGALGRMIRSGTRRFLARPVPDPVEVRVWQKAEALRLQQARAFFGIINLVSAPVVIFNIYHVAAWANEGTNDELFQYTRLFLNWNRLPIAVVGAIATLLLAVPPLLSPRGLDCANVVIFSMFMWKVMMTDQEWFYFTQCWMNVCRAGLAVTFGNAQLNSVLHLALFTTDVIRYRLGVHEWAAAEQGFDAHIGREIFILMGLVAMAWVQERRLLGEARALVDMEQSHQASGLVRRVLGCMCDAVVQLDAGLCLAEPCPQLSSLLLRHGPLLPGTRLGDLMPQEEAERFSACVAQGSKPDFAEGGEGEGTPPKAGLPLDQGFAGACHLNLKDGCGTPVPVGLYYSCIPDWDGRPSYLVGVQEDRESPPRYPDAADGGAAVASAVQARLAAVPEGRLPGPTPTSHSSWSVASDPDIRQDPHVWVDLASDGLPVLACSPSFALLGGLDGVCHKLSEWLSSEDLRRVGDWLAARPREECSVALSQPGCRVSHRCRLSTCLEGVPPPEAPPSGNPVCLHIKVLDYKTSSRRSLNQKVLKRVAGPRSERSGQMDAIEVWVSSTREMTVGDTAGSTKQQRRAFREHKHLCNWLEQPESMLFALGRAVEEHRQESDHGLPRRLGTFAFAALDPKGVRCMVDVTFTGISPWDEDYPYCLTFTGFPKMDGGVATPASGAETPAVPGGGRREAL